MNNTPYLSIKQASGATGLSQKYIREGCKNGKIPFLRVGNRYMINLPILLEKLDSMCENNERRLNIR